MVTELCAHLARCGKGEDVEFITKLCHAVIQDMFNGVEVSDFYYVRDIKNAYGQKDFYLAVFVTDYCTKFTENMSLYKHLTGRGE